MDIVKKIIVFAAGLVIVIGFVALGMGIYKKAKPVADNGASQISSILDGLAPDWNSKFKDGGEYSGSVVMQALEDLVLDGNIDITVVTIGNSGVTYNQANVNNKVWAANDRSNSSYISPSATFKASGIEQDKSGRMIAVTFTKQP